MFGLTAFKSSTKAFLFRGEMRMLSENLSLKTTSSRSTDRAGEACKLWLRRMEVICDIGMERR